MNIRDTLNARFPGYVCVYLISDVREAEFDFDHQTKDETGEFLARYEIDRSERMTEGWCWSAEPDLYIGMSCCMSEREAVSESLEQWYVSVVANGDVKPSSKA